MLPLTTFHNLSQAEKICYLDKKGVRLATRENFGYQIYLYHVPDFFVEIYFNPDSAQCEYILSFYSILWLEPYCEIIHLNLDF